MGELCTILHSSPVFARLRRLHLASNTFNLSSLRTLCGYMEEHPSFLLQLEVLGLTNNHLCQDDDSLSLAGCLLSVLRLRSRTIRRLHLNHVGIHADDVVEILSFLMNKIHSGGFPSLDKLYLKQNEELNASELNRELSARFTDTVVTDFLKKYVLL
ncbi:hypothetical protein AGDE_13162 [Angomonas deanei]|uniref:Leucine Rich repeat n=1 Tax=Angomonas deanei TaxID=59799 RepID=A0A7G2C8U7_9TRYP|nr:hypothetical protein AGDE_13162 [Angomonas deanei]CAD2215544.1 hypothetical protein, conserved [Angomonas deanei]|eukprot:EPY22689.1 hypothetical protein AGDE_13162 [Angomonas deanei]